MPRLTMVVWVGLCFLTLATTPVVGGESPNEKTVRELFAAIDAGNLDRVRELVGEDLALRSVDGAQVWSRDTLLQAIKEFYAAFPDNTHMIGQTVAAGDRVAVMVTCHATSKGPYSAPRSPGGAGPGCLMLWLAASTRGCR